MLAFLRKHAMASISVFAALLTCALVPLDAEYLGYIDIATLGKIACMLMTVAGLRTSGVFQAVAALAVCRCTRARSMVAACVVFCAVASMFITNDMALLALLPLTVACLVTANRQDLMAPTFIFEGIAANLCGMLLPFGNPQNIYLAGFFDITFGQFVQTMAPPFLVSVVVVVLGCAGVVKGGIATRAEIPRIERAWTLAFALLLAVCILTILDVVPLAWGVLIVFVGTLVAKRELLLQIDWSLIVTFVALFVFSGNLARVEAVSEFFVSWMQDGAFIASALLSQLISNVPAAVVLSHFTQDWAGLLVGVNVGGVGTPLASLATLIVVAQYRAFLHDEHAQQLNPADISPCTRSDTMPETTPTKASGLASNCASDATPGTTPDTAPSATSFPRFMALLIGANVLALVVLLGVGLLLAW